MLLYYCFISARLYFNNDEYEDYQGDEAYVCLIHNTLWDVPLLIKRTFLLPEVSWQTHMELWRTSNRSFIRYLIRPINLSQFSKNLHYRMTEFCFNLYINSNLFLQYSQPVSQPFLQQWSATGWFKFKIVRSCLYRVKGYG